MNDSRSDRLPASLAAPRSRRATLADVAGLAAALATGAGAARGRGLQATPAPDTLTGITTQILGTVEPPDAPGQTLSLLRVVFAAGASLPAHTHPGTTIYWLESGTLGFTLLAGEATITRAAAGDPAATPSPTESIPVGTEITVAAGDVLSFGDAAPQAERTVGNEPVVILLTSLRPTGAPFREAVEGTPIA